MKDVTFLRSLSDDELLHHLSELLSRSRRVEAELVAHIAEVDERRLYAREACSSMFSYCIERLHLSEHEAYERIAAARVSRRFPVLLEMLADGRLNLTGVGKLAPHLTCENHEEVLRRAEHKTKREIEELVAELSPKPDVPPVIRKLPEPVPKPAPLSVPELGPDRVAANSPIRKVVPSSPPPVVQPLAPARYKISFTAGSE